jgi:hypothetical protein
MRSAKREAFGTAAFGIRRIFFGAKGVIACMGFIIAGFDSRFPVQSVLAKEY